MNLTTKITNVREIHGAKGLGFSVSAYMESIDMCIDVLHKTIVKKYIKMPKKEEAKKCAKLIASR